ncbi:MAG: hypothetical protein AB7G28_22085 [Pirellulales bacterium]
MSEPKPAECDSDQADDVAERAPTNPPRLIVGIVDIALALHFAAGALWWWFSPKGFPIDSPQFWMNQVLPIAAMTVAAAGLVAMHYKHQRFAALAVISFAAAWAAAAILGRIVFPVSLAGVWLLFLFAAFVGATLWLWLTEGPPRAMLANFLSVFAGAAIGLLVVFGQIPSIPSTIPAEPSTEINLGKPIQFVGEAPVKVKVSKSARFLPQIAQIEGHAGDIWFECRPFLEFHSTSPDRFWSLLSRSLPNVPRFVGTLGEPADRTFLYRAGEKIVFAPAGEDEVCDATVTTPVASDTYSHLNTYCYFRFYATTSPALTFLPCGDKQFAVLPADYPIGRPARFAYFAADGTFRVCEASSGEKGPFQTLGSGRLDRGEPVSMGLHNDGKLVATITLDDWSAQASTAISPTAGWGVPVNAIEFKLIDDDGDQGVGIWITLAGTSVGRGFETVGHKAGTYRNRLIIRQSPKSAGE